ncbi:cytochrome P450 [Mycena latifolia]|nr:cytochrome P450 [Mycena latifolia]
MVWEHMYTGSVTIVAVVALCLSTLFTYYARARKSAKTNITELGGFSLLAAWPFFAKRNDFLWSNFKKIGQNMFRFRLLQYHVVVMHGDDARKAFFNDKGLNLNEGYRLLMGGSPKIEDINVSAGEYGRQFFLKNLSDLFTKERLAELFPSLMRDTASLMDGWGAEGTINPFDELNQIVFQLTVRMGSCHELAEDKKTVARMAELLDVVEVNSTPASLLLPWFPSPARRAKDRAIKELFMTLGSYVELRRAASVRTREAIDHLLGEGCATSTIIQFVIGLIHAGYINTGINVCWNVVYIGMHPEWKEKVTAEIQLLLANHTNTESVEPLHERLAAIPLNVWETELPVLDSIIRETQRITMGATALRRNLGDEILVGDKTIPKGDFLVYSLADVHANPDIYSEPSKFDPRRFDSGREEDKKAPLGFLGWGAGRHMCAGMRVAKLEVKLIMVLFFSTFEFRVVDSSGSFPKSLPQADFNEFKRTSSASDCYIKFKRILAE